MGTVTDSAWRGVIVSGIGSTLGAGVSIIRATGAAGAGSNNDCVSNFSGLDSAATATGTVATLAMVLDESAFEAADAGAVVNGFFCEPNFGRVLVAFMR